MVLVEVTLRFAARSIILLLFQFQIISSSSSLEFLASNLIHLMHGLAALINDNFSEIFNTRACGCGSELSLYFILESIEYNDEVFPNNTL